VKVRALFYVFQQVIKRGCAYFDTASRPYGHAEKPAAHVVGFCVKKRMPSRSYPKKILLL
ncbi:MAG: hypothetical protein K2K36_06235, partial [Muribaculaceae bacterium]|nr:hypothetical protein [Muribaculaceae bacterium]